MKRILKKEPRRGGLFYNLTLPPDCQRRNLGVWDVDWLHFHAFTKRFRCIASCFATLQDDDIQWVQRTPDIYFLFVGRQNGMWNHRTKGECQDSKHKQLRELLRKCSCVAIDLFILCQSTSLALDVLDQSGNDCKPCLAFGTLKLVVVVCWRAKVIV